MTIRLGFSVRVLGVTGLKSHDARRWQRGPHLSVSLAYLHDILGYLRRQKIRFYRISPQLAPYATHPNLPCFRNQIAECQCELAAIGKTALTTGIRLSVHPGQYVVLNTPEEELANRARQEVVHQAQMLQAMGLGLDGVVVLHVGGVYDDHHSALERFVRQVDTLVPKVRCRLALEHDDHLFSVADCLWIYNRTGIPLVFDYLHFRCHNPERLTLAEALRLCLDTWGRGVRPKVHFSSPRTAMMVVEQHDAMSGRVRRRTRAPRLTQHADYVDTFAFADFLHTASNLNLREFDVMLEARAGDLALLRLREYLMQLTPKWATQVA